MGTPKPLHLKIEWNGQLKVGEHLSPKFVLTGDDLRKLESISCELDPRLPQSVWETRPKKVSKDEGWFFTEHLSLNSADDTPLNGVFTIDIAAEFQIVQNSQLVAAKYETTILLEVKGGNDNPIIVRAKDSSLVRIRKNSNGPIVVEADGDSVVDVGDPILQAAFSDEPKPNIIEVDVEPCFVQTIPPSVRNPFLFLHAKLSDGHERYFQIVARQEVLLGRARKSDVDPKENIAASDFVYRFYRDEINPDKVAFFLSKRISRNQLRMTLSENGLELENLGSGITLQEDNDQKSLPRNCARLIDLDRLTDPINMKFAKFSSISLEKYFAQVAWNNRIEKKLQNYRYLCDFLRNPLWNIGTALGVNSLRLKRSPKHPVDASTLDFIKHLAVQKDPDISMESPWWTNDLMANEEEYHLIVRMLTIGNDSMRDAMFFDREGMQNQHATLYFCDNHFGLINHSKSAITYRQYGKENQLYEDECLPLQPGMTFKIGSVDFHIYESYSSYLDVQRQAQEETRDLTRDATRDLTNR